MTGEITLRGRILPVGGIREKALAARRVGIKTFLMPKKNESDLIDIPKKLRQDMEFVKIDRMHQLLDAVLLAPQPVRAKKRTPAKATPIPRASVPPA
jgi:ATP-dependent Lon protease